MTFSQIKDQLLGLVYGVGIAVAVAVVTVVAQADNEEIYKTSFWVATGAVAIRSVGTALLTILGVKLPGISGGKEEI